MTLAELVVELGWRRGSGVQCFFAAAGLFAEDGVVLDAQGARLGFGTARLGF